MAKVGEGDQRWIVAERPDGTNVNNWHWQESTLNDKMHSDLKNVFKNLPLADGKVEGGIEGLKITEVDEVSGDCSVAQRKGKIFCYFDLKLTLKYSGKVSEDDSSVGGKITIPDVDHDTFREDDYAMSVAAGDRGAAQSKAENYVRNQGRARVRKAIRDYFEQLFIDYNVGKGVPTQKPSGSPAAAAAAAPVKKAPAPSSPSSSSGVAAVDATSFDETLVWKVPPPEIWQLLVDAPRASAFTRSQARIDPRPNGAFEYLGGAMSGYFVEVDGNNFKLSMQWRLSSWPSNVFSSVVIQLKQEDANTTKMEFAQVGIPAGDMERVKTGWHNYFWNAIKTTFGFPFELK